MALVMAVCCVATVTPWLVRNEKAAGRFAFSDPAYFEVTLADRVGYDTIGWRDWSIAWLAYLPDFGDKLTATLFGRAAVERLGWGPTSYYIHGHDTLLAEARKQAGTGNAAKILLDDYVFGRPVKHAAVSAVLLWRGVFLGRYWGMAGLLALIAFFLAAGRSWAMSVIGLPTLAIAALNAVISVSITRYNLQLVMPGAIALGWLMIAVVRGCRRAYSIGPA